MAAGGFNVGSIFADIGFRFDGSGADRFDRRYAGAEAKAAKPIVAEARIDVDDDAFDRAERHIRQVDRAANDLAGGGFATLSAGTRGVVANLGVVSGSLGAVGQAALVAAPALVLFGGALGALAGSFAAASAGAGVLATGGLGVLAAGLSGVIGLTRGATESFEKITSAIEARNLAVASFGRDSEQAERAQKKLNGTVEEFGGDRMFQAVLAWRQLGDTFRNLTNPAMEEGRSVFIALLGAVERVMPTVAAVTNTVAQALSGPLQAALERLSGGEMQGIFASLGDAFARIAPAGVEAITNVIVGIARAAEQAAPFFENLAYNVADLAERFANWAAGDGISRLFADLVRHTQSWWDLLVAVGGVIGAIFSSGASEGRGLVDTLTDAANEFREFLETGGRDDLISFFKACVTAVEAIIDVIQFLGRVAAAQVGAIKTVFGGLVNIILGGVSTLMDAIAEVARIGARLKIPGMDALARDAQNAANRVNQVRRELNNVPVETVSTITIVTREVRENAERVDRNTSPNEGGAGRGNPGNPAFDTTRPRRTVTPRAPIVDVGAVDVGGGAAPSSGGSGRTRTPAPPKYEEEFARIDANIEIAQQQGDPDRYRLWVRRKKAAIRKRLRQIQKLVRAKGTSRAGRIRLLSEYAQLIRELRGLSETMPGARDGMPEGGPLSDAENAEGFEQALRPYMSGYDDEIATVNAKERAGLYSSDPDENRKIAAQERIKIGQKFTAAGVGTESFLLKILGDIKQDTDSLKAIEENTKKAAEDMAARLWEMFEAFNQQRRDLFNNFGNNFVRADTPYFTTDDQRAEGYGSYGAGSGSVAPQGAAPLAGARVAITMMEPPPDPHNWARGLDFELEAMTA
jgi:hypothetical protein